MQNIDSLLEYINAERSKPVQLVKHLDEVPESKLTYPALVEEKYDGVWCGVLVYKGEVALITRTGKKMYFQFSQPVFDYFYEECLFIGELVNPKMSLEELSGAVNPNRVIPWDESTADKMQDCVLMLHDRVTIEEFKNGFSQNPYHWRRMRASLTKSPIYRSLGLRTEMITSVAVNSKEDVLKYADMVIKNGGEGVVRKEREEGWTAGHKGFRATKVVRGVDLDLRCTGFSFGNGKREGQIATLRFSYKGKDFNADLGKGWDDAKRAKLTEEARLEGNEGYPIDSIFHIHGLQISSKGVIRLPKVMEERIDKVYPDA